MARFQLLEIVRRRPEEGVWVLFSNATSEVMFLPKLARFIFEDLSIVIESITERCVELGILAVYFFIQAADLSPICSWIFCNVLYNLDLEMIREEGGFF